MNSWLAKLHNDNQTQNPICCSFASHLTDSSKTIANKVPNCIGYQILHMALFFCALLTVASATTEMFVTFLDVVEKSKSFKPCPKNYEFVKGHNEDGIPNCKSNYSKKKV